MRTHKRPRMGSHDINEEIIMDILSMLPVKSLLRFKCVSKFWKTLISQPYFHKKHLCFHAKNENSKKLLIGESIDCETFYLYSTCLSTDQIVKDMQRIDGHLSSKPYAQVTVYCSCDGLVLIRVWDELSTDLLLWNPSTRKSITLPYLEYDPLEEYVYGFYVYGLGYDSTSDDYKVLRIDIEHEVVQLLALKSGSWRKIDEGLTPYRLSHRACLAFVHGAFHWCRALSDTIVTWNISNEMYGEIPMELPSYNNTRVGALELGVSVLAGMLCVYFNHNITSTLWVMKDYGVKEPWTKLFSIPTNGPLLIPLYRFLNGEVILNYMTKSGGICRISDGSSSPVWPLDSDDIDVESAFVYIESLIFPKLGH